jgi:predicted transcriptional regulator
MTQSKLEVHLQLLKIVAQKGPAKERKVALQASVATDVAKQSLTFLFIQGLLGYNQGAYQITCRGRAVLRHFRMLNEQEEIEEMNC